MHTKTYSSVQRLTISAIVIALYTVIMYVTQSFAFGAYQIRIATALYALAYLFPFLIIPLGCANLLSNLVLGGLGVFDIVGGLIVGVLTSTLVYLVRRKNLPCLLTAIPIILIPGLLVATWLSYLLQIPYGAMALSLLIGQVIPGVVGALCIVLLRNKIPMAPIVSKKQVPLAEH